MLFGIDTVRSNLDMDIRRAQSQIATPLFIAIIEPLRCSHQSAKHRAELLFVNTSGRHDFLESKVEEYH
jgi:hypothetical protein